MSASTSPPPTSGREVARRIDAARRQARRVILAERSWSALRVALLIVALFALGGLLRIPQSLPDWLHAIIEAVVLLGALALAARGIRRIESPATPELDRRIERASQLPFQPLLALADHPAGVLGEGMWQIHTQRVAHALGALRAGWPRPQTGPLERRMFAIVVAALLAALVAAGSHAPSRLAAAFIPGRDDADVPLPQVQAWIDMPDYAPGAPVFLDSHSGHAEIPQGAQITATITGVRGEPKFAGIPLRPAAPRRLDAGSWTLQAALEGSGALRLRARGRDIAEWTMKVQPDLPPVIAWGGKPQKEESGFATAFPWKVSQAHGVRSLEVELRLKSARVSRVLKVPLQLDGTPKDAKGSESVDLSADPWAGEDVTAVLLGISASGREGRSTTETFRLQSRPFHDPVAKALVALRKRMALGQETRKAAADELRGLAEVTPRAETGTILGMMLEASGLENPDEPAAMESAMGMCWAMALYLEDVRQDGRDTALANLDIRAAQEAVQAQIARMRALGPAGQAEAQQEELSRRLKTLREAIDRRMQALMREAMRNGTMLPETGDAQGDADDAFSRLMRRLQSESANGHGDEAMKQLQQLQSMTEAMRNATPEDLQNMAHQLRAQQEAASQRQALHDLVKHETGLLDHAQSRLAAQRRAQSTDQDEDNAPAGGTGSDQGEQDLATMSTAELLRHLGISPPAEMNQSGQPSSTPAQPAPLDPQLRAVQSGQRRADHAIQSSLQHAATALNEDVKTLVGKKLKGLSAATKDMITARQAIAAATDDDAQRAEIQVLKDLAEAGKQMSEAQKGKSHGGGPIALLPGFGNGDKKPGGKARNGQGSDGDASQDGSDDDARDRDPLGRKLGEGKSATDSDGHIPEANQHDRAREIERELRRRDSDRTRPHEELEYLDRLLKSY